MACRLVGTELLSEQMLQYCWFELKEKTSVKSFENVSKVATTLSLPQCVNSGTFKLWNVLANMSNKAIRYWTLSLCLSILDMIRLQRNIFAFHLTNLAIICWKKKCWCLIMAYRFTNHYKVSVGFAYYTTYATCMIHRYVDVLQLQST